MVDPVSTSQVNAALRTPSTSGVSKTSQRATQALLDLQQKANGVSVSSKQLAATNSSKPPSSLPRGSLVDVLV